MVLDQTLLPSQERWVSLRTSDEVVEAIKKLRVRGAPLIGIAAAMGLQVAMSNEWDPSKEEFFTLFHRNVEKISASRPTAVNLQWALNRMEKCAERYAAEAPEQILEHLKTEALAIKQYEETTCDAIGKFGSALIADGMGILTHCNAGALATGHLGTALAPIYMAHQQGKRIKVFADETRPLLQGARLTAYELMNNGIDTTLICDNMAASIMAKGWVQMIFVGCDRVATNGDTANKIGTLGVAILAKHFSIPFYVCGPTSTFDSNCASGEQIPIELRNGEEIRSLWYKEPMTPEGCTSYNPSFDVTPHELITGYITEKGIIKN